MLGIKKFDKFVCVFLLVITFFLIFTSINLFWRGYHNIDLVFNFQNVGDSDRTTENIILPLEQIYINGLNQIKGGFGWLCLGLITAFLSGFFLKK